MTMNKFETSAGGIGGADAACRTTGQERCRILAWQRETVTRDDLGYVVLADDGSRTIRRGILSVESTFGLQPGNQPILRLKLTQDWPCKTKECYNESNVELPNNLRKAIVLSGLQLWAARILAKEVTLSNSSGSTASVDSVAPVNIGGGEPAAAAHEMPDRFICIQVGLAHELDTLIPKVYQFVDRFLPKSAIPQLDSIQFNTMKEWMTEFMQLFGQDYKYRMAEGLPLADNGESLNIGNEATTAVNGTFNRAAFLAKLNWARQEAVRQQAAKQNG